MPDQKENGHMDGSSTDGVAATRTVEKAGRPLADTRACWHAAEQLASKYPNLRVVVDDDAVMPLSTAMWLRVVLCVVDAYEDR